MSGKITMKRDVFEVITDAEHAIGYTNQELVVLDLWLDSMGIEDDTEANRIAAVQDRKSTRLNSSHRL